MIFMLNFGRIRFHFVFLRRHLHERDQVRFTTMIYKIAAWLNVLKLIIRIAKYLVSRIHRNCDSLNRREFVSE